MRILKLEAEQIKRLHAVSITPAGNIVEISGANGAGKSSTLDAIWYALSGARSIPSQPIRKGAETARIRLDLGEIVVTRTFKRKDENEYTTSVKVEGADGSSYKSPQDILNAMLSSLTFDPLEFSRMDPKKQFDMLRAFVPDVDFEKIDNQNRGDFERRTTENRRMQEAKAAAGLIVIREDLPDDEIDESALVDKIADAGRYNAAIERENEHRKSRAEDINLARRKLDEYHAQAIELRRKADELDRLAGELNDRIEIDVASLASAGSIGKPIDVQQVRAELTQAQTTNVAIRGAAESRRRKTSLEKVASDAALLSDELTAKINARNKAKTDAIAAAKMPVEGLGFGDGFVTFGGVPFDQASSAEQLRASIAIAMSTNTKLRVIRVRDGSLLDAESFKILEEMAKDKDYSVWVESVFPHTDAAIVIEDGRVKASAELARESAA